MSNVMIKIALVSFKKDWKTTLFTIIGIALAIFFVFTVRSLGQGVILKAQQQFDLLGQDKVYVVPFNANIIQGAQNIFTYLKKNEIKSLTSFPFITSKAEIIFGKKKVCYAKECISISIYGTESSIFSIYKSYMKLEKGRIFRDNEKGVAVIGGKVNQLFNRKIDIGKSFFIGNKSFRIIGILKPVGNSFSKSDDLAIYIPLKEAEALTEKYGIRDLLILEVKGYDIEEARDTLEQTLLRKRGLREEDKNFMIITAKFVEQTITKTLDRISLGIFLISSITFLVAMFGITNTMLEAAIRRRKQIALLKALGMKNKNIAFTYIIETLFITLIGSFIGIAIAMVFVYIIDVIFNLPFTSNVIDVLLVIGVSILSGLIASSYPSYYAYSLNIIKALRN